MYLLDDNEAKVAHNVAIQVYDSHRLGFTHCTPADVLNELQECGPITLDIRPGSDLERAILEAATILVAEWENQAVRPG